MNLKKYIVAGLLVTSIAWAGSKIQRQGIKTAAECVAAGSTAANCLPLHSQIYDSTHGQTLDQTVQYLDATSSIQNQLNSKQSSVLTDGAILVGNAANVATSVIPSGDLTMNNAGAFTLANTAVTPGTYSYATVTVDAKGRLTAAANGSSVVSGASALNQNYIFVGDATNYAAGVPMSGDATIVSSGALTVGNSVISNAKLASMGASTIKGNATFNSTSPTDLTGSQVTLMLNTMVGDSGSGGSKGLVPAPAAGDAAANKFLNANGGWSAINVSGGSGSSVLVGFAANLSSSPSIPTGSSNTVVYDTELWDTTSSYDPGTGVFTVPATGYWEFKVLGNIVLSSTSAVDDTYNVFLFKNNSTTVAHAARIYVPTVTTNWYDVMSLSITLYLTTGDTIRVNKTGGGGNTGTYLYQTSTGNAPQFQGTFIGI